MKGAFRELPKALQRQVAIRSGTGMLFFFLFIVILAWFQDWYFSLPCLVFALFLVVSGVCLFYNGCMSNYLCIQGVCEKIETTGIRKRVKSIRVQVEGRALKVPIRQKMKKLATGDIVKIYLSDKAPVYEHDGGYLICSYYALETEKECSHDESK